MASVDSVITGKLKINVHRALNLVDTHLIGKNDPYVKIYLDTQKKREAQKGKYEENDDGKNPLFDLEFEFDLDGKERFVNVEVCGRELLKDSILGTAKLTIDEIVKQAGDLRFSIPLKSKDGSSSAGSLILSACYSGSYSVASDITSSVPIKSSNVVDEPGAAEKRAACIISAQQTPFQSHVTPQGEQQAVDAGSAVGDSLMRDSSYVDRNLGGAWSGAASSGLVNSKQLDINKDVSLKPSSVSSDMSKNFDEKQSSNVMAKDNLGAGFSKLADDMSSNTVGSIRTNNPAYGDTHIRHQTSDNYYAKGNVGSSVPVKDRDFDIPEQSSVLKDTQIKSSTENSNVPRIVEQMTLKDQEQQQPVEVFKPHHELARGEKKLAESDPNFGTLPSVDRPGLELGVRGMNLGDQTRSTVQTDSLIKSDEQPQSSHHSVLHHQVIAEQPLLVQAPPEPSPVDEQQSVLSDKNQSINKFQQADDSLFSSQQGVERQAESEKLK